ncbi:NlpC/P60 family protein [Micrococcus porci]|uniref:NlpC/P60 family protein n=1 Tax=Micrococcus porci TaxID=2856555 RepID=UPI003CF1A3C2
MPEAFLAPARRPRAAAASLALALGAGAGATAGAAVIAPQAQAAETYTVRAGDGWWIISQRTGVPMTTLMQLNGMTSADMLHPGMVLKTSGTVRAAAGTYTVKAGDGWYAISRATGVPVSTLTSLNGMTITSMLHPGMVLKTTGTPASTAPAPAPAPAPVVRQSSKQAAIDFAVAKVNDPNTYYAWGGNGTYGYDCSGLTKAAFAAAGITIPRVSHDQYVNAPAYAPLSQAQPGDLVFWANQSTGRVYHVAVYIGNGKVAHALNTTDDLVITSTDIMTSNRLAVVGRY